MKRALLALLAVLAFCGTASAQGYFYSQPIINSQGLPAPGANAAVCTTIATTAAAVAGNLATLTMASNPLTAGFTPGGTIVVSNFTGADVYFNGNYQVAAVNSTQILYSLVHANASASSNGNVVQEGTPTTACAPLATLYTDVTLTATAPNPFTADGYGNLNFWAQPDQYYSFVYGPTVLPTLAPVSIPCVPGSSCGGGGSGSCSITGITSLEIIYNDAGTCAGAGFKYYLGTPADPTTCPGPSSATTFCLEGTNPVSGNILKLGTDEIYLNTTTGGVQPLSILSQTELYFSANEAPYDAANAIFSLDGIAFTGLNGTDLQYTNGSGNISIGNPDGAGLIDLIGSTSGTGAIGVEDIAGTPGPLLLPTSSGTNGQVLATDGGSPDQNLYWADGGTGTVTSVSGISGFLGVTDGTTAAQLTLTDPITAQLIFSGSAFPQFNGGFGCATGSAPSAASGYDILYCDSSTGNLLLSNNGGGFGQVLTGTVAVGSGGTGRTTVAAGDLLCGNGSGTLSLIVPVSSGDVLTDNGAGACGSYQAPPSSMSTSLDAITAAMADSTIGNGAYQERWNSVLAGSETAFYLGEASAASGAGNIEFRVSTLNTSTSIPVRFDNNGNGVEMTDVGVLGKLGTGYIDWAGLGDFPTACTNQFVTEATTSSLGCTTVNMAHVTGTTPIANGGTAQTAAPVKRVEFDLASCNQQASPQAGGAGLPTTGGMVPTCKQDSTNGTIQGTLNAAHSQVVYFTWVIPADWASFNAASIEFTTTDTTSGHTAIFNVQTACTAPNGGNTDTPAYNAANAFTTVTLGGGAVANALYSTSATPSGTGCAASDVLHLKLTRSAGDTVTDTAIALTGALVLAYNGAYN